MSICKQYPAGTIIIAPSLYHTLLRKELLAENKGVIGIHMYSLPTFLSLQTRVEHNPHEVLFVCYSTLQGHAAEFKIFHDIYKTYDFIHQCLFILKELMFYDIELSALPRNNPTQLEIYNILTYLYPITLIHNAEQTQLDNLKRKDLHHIVIYDPTPSYHDYQIYKRLLKQGATYLTLPKVEGRKEFYHAVHKRKEIEACAQAIIEGHLQADDIHIYVCDPSYKAIINQIFSRYKIPFTILRENHTSIITKRFLNLLQYAFEPNQATLLEVLDTNTLQVSYPREFLEYCKIFEKTLDAAFDHMKKLQGTSKLIDEKEIQQLKILEEKARETQAEIRLQLLPLVEYDNIPSLFQQVNTLVVNSMYSHDQKQSDALSQMQQQLSTIAEYVTSRETLAFALDILSQANTILQEKQYKGCLIADMSNALPPVAHTFILGATQKNYPAFSPLTGIFDETYVKQFSYPSLPHRYDFHIQCLNQKLDACPHLIVSFPLGTYEGKGNEAALEIEEYVAIKPSPYPLIENFRPVPSTFTINGDTAHRLYTKDNTLHGSISAFERYVKCPFSYFLRYGLGLREPADKSFSPSRIGTLAHQVLEAFVQAYGKQYAQATQAEIATILNHEMQAMAHVYPSFEKQLQLTKQRLLHSIEKTMARLQEMEEHSALTPSKCEYAFSYEIPILDDITMIMKGFIDRIDESSGFARIIDYKSSVKSLQEKEVFAALQLQLITYSLVVEKDLQKPILGAYYYSLKNENIMCSAGKLKRRPAEFVPFTKHDYEEDQKASHRLRGWTMNNNVDLLDDDGTHILGVSQNKDGLIKARKTYNLNVIKAHFHEMYEQIGTKILSGNIDVTPVEEACLFCKYREICRFKGYYREHTPLVDVNDTIYQGGEE